MIEEKNQNLNQYDEFFFNIMISETKNLACHKDKNYLIDPFIKVTVFDQEQFIMQPESQQENIQHWKKSLHFIQSSNDIKDFENKIANIQVLNKKDNQLLGYLNISIMNLLFQDNFTIINKKFNLINNKDQTEQIIILSININKQFQSINQNYLNANQKINPEYYVNEQFRFNNFINSEESVNINQKILNFLQSYLNKGNNQSQSFNLLLQNISKIYQNFSLQLQSVAEQFHQEISQSVEQIDEIIISSQFISNYLLKLAQKNFQFIKNFNAEVVEPYQQVSNAFKQTNQNIYDNLYEDQQKLQLKADSIKREKEIYYKMSQKIEQTDSFIDKVSHKLQNNEFIQEEFKKLMNQQYEQKIKNEEFIKNYQFSIDNYNNSWSIYQQKIQKYLEEFDLNNDSRLSFTKYSLLRLIKAFDKMEGERDDQLQKAHELKLHENHEKFQNNVKISIVDKLEHDLKQKLPFKQLNLYKEIFITYLNSIKNVKIKQIQEQVSQSELFGLSEQVQITNQRMINQILSDIFYNSKNNNNYIIQNQNIFTSSNSIQYFVKLVKYEFNNRKVIGLHENEFNQCKDVFTCILNIFNENMNSIDILLLMDIIKICTSIYKYTDKRQTVYLSFQLSNLQIWNNFYIWNQIFDMELKIKVKQNESKQKKGYFKNFFMKSMDNLQKNMKINALQYFNIQSQKDQNNYQEDQSKLQDQILETINNYLISLGLSVELASGLIIKLTQKTDNFKTKEQIEKSILHKLLEQQSNKRISNLRNDFIIQKQTKKELNKQKILNKVLEFLNLQQIYQFSYQNSDFNRKANKIILQRNQNYSVLQKNRIKIWKQILRVEQKDYNILLKNIDQIANQQNDEIINLDVLRSFQIHIDVISQNTLFRLLKTYAYLKPEINYCQGMNYVMGFIYLQSKNENESLDIFIKLLDTHFKNVFTQDLKQLKILFYQFEKCLDLYLPDLAEHFKIVKIDCQYFIAPWLITIFGNVYQNTGSSFLAMNIWDIFICQGYKGFFKVCLLILKIYKAQLLELQFENILNFLIELPKSSIFMISDDVSNFKNDDYLDVLNIKYKISEFKITKQILKDLEKEYFNSKEKILQIIEQLKNKL